MDSDRKQLYVAIVDSESNRELVRVSSRSDLNELQPQLIRTDHFIGRKVFVRVVDKSRDSWGHINFGGLYAADPATPVSRSMP